MFYESNQDRAAEKQAYDKMIAKLMKEKDHMSTQYQEMVDEVTNMFDWQDGVGRVNYHEEHQKSKNAENLQKEQEDLEMQKDGEAKT